MSIEVTVILPSHNRYPLNQLTLISLEHQTFDLAKMEVILIDDASTDDTHVLQNYNPPYPYTYIRNAENLGRSKTRNIGIKAAKGQILIFLDAEVIVDPDFVNNHYQRHRTDEDFVITGRNMYNVYSYLFPGFNRKQLKTFYQIAEDSPLVKKRLEKAFYPQKPDRKALAEMIQTANQPVQLLFPEDCRTFSNIKLFSILKAYEKKIIDSFRDDFRLPWLSCTTLNHSVRKKVVESIGGFDESFVGHGLEDFEYGFRLFSAGVKFSYDPNIYVYHQEHPIDVYWKEDGTKNLILFQQKHPCLDIYLLSLSRIDHNDFALMDNVMMEHQAISRNDPARFEHFMNGLFALLKQIPLLRAAGEPVTDLAKATGIDDDEDWKNRIWLERKELEKNGYQHVTKLFDLLISL